MIKTATDWLLHNGVGQNITGWGLCGTPAGIYARRKFLKHMENIHLHIRIGDRYDEPKN